MEPVQLVALVVSLAFTAVGVTLFVRMVGRLVAIVRLGEPAVRTDRLGARIAHAATETLLHTRMLQWTKVGIAHWWIMIGFGLLFATLVNAYGQLFDAHFALPVIGHFPLFEWLTELFAWAMVIAIIPLMVYRATRPRERVRGEAGRLYGSTMWQGYFVEWVILTVGICILLLRSLEYALSQYGADPDNASLLHFPLSSWLGQAFDGLSEPTLANLIWTVAAVKIVISMTWMIVLGRTSTMGVAWHRFLAPFNVLFKREAGGGPALGAAKPLTSAGHPVTLDAIDDLDEDAVLGVGAAEQFSWKGILDFTSCTECGRCQSQCPAWNTEKPLSPKLLITALRDHTHAKAPYLLAAEGSREQVLADGGDTLVAEVERPLIGDESVYGVIDPDVLWSCTTCGACVQQCPVDIEHVDHIVDMRRYQVLVEANFPAELTQLFRGLENKGNPWNMAPAGRLDWTKGLDFEIPVVGDTLESLDTVDWLFWVGCAGAFEDRAKKTTQAVAELLNTAGVSFGILGTGETCTGDPARRAGNEFVFQGLAQQNIETFREYRVKQVVTTCAHCFNTLRNEYRDFGIELDVVHHTQLLNRLVREGRLTPVPSGPTSARRSITYHDPCYLGRHNQVYAPPRELLQVLPGADFVEMERSAERSFCCGAGGARMWMEENIGERINNNRTAEAVGTGADQIAVGCPFCRVMLSDGLTAAQAKGEARDSVEVLDVAQLLLASVKGEPGKTGATRAAPASAAGAAAAGAAADSAPDPVATEPVDAASAAPEPAAGGGSLFDVPAPEPTPAAQPETPTPSADPEPAAGGGSLFDVPAPEPTPAAQPETPTPAAPTGGSLFDVPAPEPTPTGAATSEPDTILDADDTPSPEPPADSIPAGSLFDIQAPATDEPPAAPEESAPEESEPEESAPEESAYEESAKNDPAPSDGPRTDVDLNDEGSLFDL